ncbi:MAG: hypothetical protein M3Q74_02730 [Pseudomonadota bacterium]|nr:hypothetical protein [Pseudomonadota bacterium]
MENSASKAPARATLLLADWFGPGSLKGPGVLGLAAAGHVALIANAQPQTLPALWEKATLNPLLAMAIVAMLGVVSYLASRLPEKRILLVRRTTIVLIAGSLSLIAGDILNLISVDQQPWAAIIAFATGIILVGGLTTFIAELPTASHR